MKKLLIGLLIALALMCLLFVACNACDKVPTAQAYVQSRTLEGVVSENLLSIYDFSNVSYMSFSSSSDFSLSTPNGIYCNDANFTEVSGSYGTTNISTSGQIAVAIVFDYLASWGRATQFFIGAYESANTLIQVSLSASRVSNNSTVLTSVSAISGPSYGTFRLGAFQAGSFLQDTKIVVIIACPYNSTITFTYLKLCYSSALYNSNYFDGFLIPDYSYSSGGSVEPDPSPYDSWNGVVNPNLLNNADFFYKPFYIGDPQLGHQVTAPTDMYYTETATSCFTGVYNFGTPPLVDSEFSVSGDPTIPAPARMSLKYRYTWRDLYNEWISVSNIGYPLTYTLYASSNASAATITLTDDLGNTVTKNILDFIVGNQMMPASLVLYEDVNGPTPVPQYVDIEVAFVGPLDGSNLTGDLYYSKLEPFALFTGFEPIEHINDSVVKSNYLSHYDFDYTNLNSSYKLNDWYISGGTAIADRVTSHPYYEDDTDYLAVDCLGGVEPVILSYISNKALFDVGTELTFSLSVISDSPFLLYVYSNGVLVGSQYYLASSNQRVRYFNSCTFTTVAGDSNFDYLRFDVKILDTNAYVKFYYAKLEVGDSFTGYVPDASDQFNAGADAVEYYNDGLPLFLEYYNFKYDVYAIPETGINDGQSMAVAPYGTYFGSYGLTQSSSFGLGLVNQSDNINSSISFDLQVHSSGSLGHYIFAFLFSSGGATNIVRISVSLDGIVQFYNIDFSVAQSKLLLIDVPADNIVITNLTPASSIYLTKYKTEYSTYFSGFPDGFDSNVPNGDFYEVGYQNGYAYGYDEGNSIGFDNGNSVGYDNGLRDGLATGRVRGQQEGYQEGLEVANNGSWLSLVTALIDVPVTTIVSFLDFDILGFNMLSAFKTIMLLSLFFFVIRFITAKVL